MIEATIFHTQVILAMRNLFSCLAQVGNNRIAVFAGIKHCKTVFHITGNGSILLRQKDLPVSEIQLNITPAHRIVGVIDFRFKEIFFRRDFGIFKSKNLPHRKRSDGAENDQVADQTELVFLQLKHGKPPF